jgi:hypothetical protein
VLSLAEELDGALAARLRFLVGVEGLGCRLGWSHSQSCFSLLVMRQEIRLRSDVA